MEQILNFHQPQRRTFIQTSVAASVSLAVFGLVNQSEAWALEVKALSPSEAKTMLQLCRDIYPHDRIGDEFYAVAVKGIDSKAQKDSKFKKQLTDGLKDLDARAQKSFKKAYVNVGWEIERNKVLQQIENTAFFQSIRGDLVVSLYNQEGVWPVFGYEGESASKGGYINRGFNDLKWL